MTTRQPRSRRPAARWTRRAVLAAPAAAALAAGATAASAAPPRTDRAGAAAWETVIDGSLTDRQALESKWNYLYPWGSDHNGTARMYAGPTDADHLYLSPSGQLNIKATRIDWDEGSSSKDPHLPIHYHSAAIHSKDRVTVSDEFPQWEIRGEFQAPSAPGTWPAFWITGANSWPPESDILEYKGDDRNWFNTYDGSWDSTEVAVGDPGAWHEYRIWMAKTSDADVEIHYYLDGTWKAAHTGSNFVGQPMHVIVNLQMEGSSGSSGPGGDTHFSARNVYVGRSRA